MCDMNLRSVTKDSEGVDTVGVEAAALQERTVIAQLHTLTAVVTALKDLHPVVLTVLQTSIPECIVMSSVKTV